jgi:hypothetical protein
MSAAVEHQVVSDAREALSRVRWAEEELYAAREALRLADDRLRAANQGSGNPMLAHLANLENYPFGDWEDRRVETDRRFEDWLSWDFDCWEGWR